MLRISAGLGGLAVVAITCVLLVGKAQYPDASWIAYVSSRPRSNTYDINRMNSDGTQVERLAVVVGSVPLLTWSPDGTMLAIVSHLDRDALTVMDLAGRSQRLLVDSVPAIQAVAWSPDGQWLAYAARSAPAAGEPAYLYRVPVGGGAVQQLIGAAASVPELVTYDSLAYSPDGEWLVFDAASAPDTSPRIIYRVPVGGGDPVQVVEGCCAGWSPDGTSILYGTAGEDGRRYLYRIPVEGGAPVPVTTTALFVSGPIVWSPDGEWMVFITFDEQSIRTLWRMRADGSELQQVATGTLQSPVSWSPDAEWLAFPMYGTASVTFQPGVYRVRADGRDLELLTDGRSSSYVPVWSPALDQPWRMGPLLLAGMALVLLGAAARHGLALPRRL
ncbi:TolB family protein [Aggregatilinea lenta]|uniref:TolB family protein n=1 Tax=Aggregatilinea lenta TaxID=913108 RepID=UPI0013C34AE7|nr:PD40 domain-containing protein [Aggregatilinea lenta]